MVAGQRHKIITDPDTNNYVTDSVVFGNSNEILLTNWGTGVTDLFLMGSHLKYQPNSYSSLRNCLGIGKYNSYSFQVTDPLFFIGNGASDVSRTNALEVNASTTKLLTNLQLAADTTAVNAITPAKNSPASADDMTLVTKSYITSQSINYEPSSEVQLTAVTSYSLGTLIGDPNWSFPYSSGSITLVFSIDQIFHTVHVPIPSYFNASIHPIIKAPLTDIHNYQITDPGDSGTLKGLLLFYKPDTKEISLENPECVNIDNVGDSITDAFNYGNIDIWFWGMTCYNHF